MANNAPKPQIRIMLEPALSANAPGFSADVRMLVDGSWEHILVNERPIAPVHSTEDGARLRALTALDNLFGENRYDLVD